MIQGLSRDYWPAGTSYPLVRTVLAFLIAPVLAAAILTAVLFAVEVVIVGSMDIARSPTLQYAPIILVGSIVVTLTGGVAVFLALWALRLRGKRHYAVAGMVVGALLAATFLSARSEPLHPITIAMAMIHLGIVMLVLRAVAGVKRIADD